MKCRYLILLVFFAMGLVGNVSALNTNLVDDVNGVIQRINTKLSAGKMDETDFADELRSFDALQAKYKGDQSEEAQLILEMKLKFYLEVFNDPENALTTLKQIKNNFSKPEIKVDDLITSLQPAVEKQKIRRTLVPGAKAPDFDEKDLNGKPFSLSSRKGKVVLVDFWATWCPACVQEMPQVVDIYKKYHDQGFEIAGISLDQNRAKLEQFLPDAGVTWPQFFDGNGWDNKLAAQYGVVAAPSNYLLDRAGKIIASNLHGPDLDAAIAKALKQ